MSRFCILGIVTRLAVRPLNMGVEDAMRFILTAGVTGEYSARLWPK